MLATHSLTRVASPAVALLVLAEAAAAQAPSPPGRASGPPRGAPPASRAAADLRPEFPFFPLQPMWSAVVGLQPSAPAATDGTKLFVSFVSGTLTAFDVRTGGIAGTGFWPTKLALVADGPRVLVTGDAVIDAIRATDATGIWKAPLPAPAAMPPVVRGGWAFVPLANGALTALRTDTGTSVWTVPLGPPVAVPVVEGDWIYAAAAGGAVHALAVQDGAAAWRVDLDGDATALAAVEGHVFAATRNRWLYALDHRGRVRWRFRLQGAAIGLGVDDDRVIAVMLDQSVRAFRIGNGAQAWRRELPFRPAAGPVVIGRSLLVSGFSPSVRIIDRRTGANQGTYAVPLPVDPGALTLETLVAGPIVVAGPTLFDDVVLLLTQHGMIHAARRAFDPPVTPLTAMPAPPLPAPARPPGYVEPPPAAPTPTPDPAALPATPPPTAPSAGTPSRTPPTPPAR